MDERATAFTSKWRVFGLFSFFFFYELANLVLATEMIKIVSRQVRQTIRVSYRAPRPLKPPSAILVRGRPLAALSIRGRMTRAWVLWADTFLPRTGSTTCDLSRTESITGDLLRTEIVVGGAAHRSCGRGVIFFLFRTWGARSAILFLKKGKWTNYSRMTRS